MLTLNHLTGFGGGGAEPRIAIRCLAATGGQTHTGWIVSSLEVYAPGGAVNLCGLGGAVAIASSYQGVNVPANMIDGDIYSFWYGSVGGAAMAGAEWCGCLLPAAVSDFSHVGRLRLRNYEYSGNDYRPTSVTVQMKLDDGAWTTVASLTLSTVAGGWAEIIW